MGALRANNGCYTMKDKPIMNKIKNRCFGNKPNQEFYANYHDYEWGVPLHDDQLLFEMLILEGAQAGLSWETILKRRVGYRTAFCNFDIQQVANLTDQALDLLSKDPQIISNRRKIYATRQNAQAFLKIQQEFGSFNVYLKHFVKAPIINNYASFEEVPTQTPISLTLSKDLKKRGMNFVGPTIIYAYMQAIGLVNDHLTTCWLRSN